MADNNFDLYLFRIYNTQKCIVLKNIAGKEAFVFANQWDASSKSNDSMIVPTGCDMSWLFGDDPRVATDAWIDDFFIRDE